MKSHQDKSVAAASGFCEAFLAKREQLKLVILSKVFPG